MQTQLHSDNVCTVRPRHPLSHTELNSAAQPFNLPSFMCKAACETPLLSQSHTQQQHNGFCSEDLEAVTSPATLTTCIKTQQPQPVLCSLQTHTPYHPSFFCRPMHLLSSEQPRNLFHGCDSWLCRLIHSMLHCDPTVLCQNI